MATTPKSLTPKMGPGASPAQSSPQQARMTKPVKPVPTGRPEPKPVDPAVAAAELPTEDELAAARARRLKAPPPGESRLYVPPRVGWVRRWVNDVPGNIQKFQNKGWDFVKNPETGQNWMLVVEKSRTEAGGRRGYVMQVPLQIYEEDQLVKKESLDALDAAIYGGTHDEEPDDKRYVPEDTPIRVETRIGPGSG